MPMNQKSLNTFPFPDLASSMLAGDCASLEGLSTDEIRVWALRKSEEYRLLSYTMLSVYNAAAPIHTLPVELLMKIFGMTWAGWDQQGLRPTSVCRRWRTVFLATPEFWAEAVAGLNPQFDGDTKLWTWFRLGANQSWAPPQFVAMLLERSWPRPIPVPVTFEPQNGSGAIMITIPTQCVLHSTVFTHPIHVVQLSIDTSLLHLLGVYHVLKAGMPALEKLKLMTLEEEPPDLTRTLARLPPVPDQCLPRLRSLSHLNPAIFFPLIAVRSLEYVYIESWQMMTVDETWIVPWPHPPGSQSRSLLRALARCTNLKHLYIEAYEPSRWWPPLEDEDSDAIYLPSLKKLCFVGGEDGTKEPYAQAILEVLDPCIPSTALVDRGMLNPRSPDSLSQLMPAYLVQHHPFDTVIIFRSGFRPNTFSAIRCLMGQTLRLDVPFSSRRNLADLGIEDVFRTTCVTHLEIIPDSREADMPDPVEDWAGVLRAFPHLTHLTVSGVDPPDSVVNALGAVAGHGVVAGTDSVLVSESLLCPALRYLTVGWEVPQEIGPKNIYTVGSVDLAAYQQDQDVRPRVEQRCLLLQLMFERRASMGTQSLHVLEFYEYERRGHNHDIDDVTEFEEFIISSRRNDGDLPCLERLRAVVGGRVVYRGYLLKMVRSRTIYDL